LQSEFLATTHQEDVMSRRRPLRVALVGLGHFAQEYVLPAIARLDSVELAAALSGSPDKLRVLGDRYRVGHRGGYDELEDVLGAGAIDLAYIAVPNDMHAEMTIRAARAGVHVLCEKPMAPTEEECVAMLRACRDAGVFLMIGYRLHFEAANLTAIDLVQRGELGDPRVFSSTFAFQVREGNTRVQDRPGAGPLYDIGIYCINAARNLFRQEPHEVVAMPLAHRTDERFAASDEAIAAALRFPDDRVASFVASYGAADTSRFEVIGTEGSLVLDNAYELADTMTLTVTRGGTTRTRTFRRRDQVAAEVEYFARCVRDGREPEPSAIEGLADVRVILAIEEAAHTRRAVGVDPVDKPVRPSPEQELRFPMHGKPRLVGVEPPTR
jgi:predicted dehydrogenase